MSADRSALRQRVREASDIVAVVSGYIAVTPAGRIFKAVCPFHNDNRPSLQIDPQWQNYRCWSCGARGDVFTFVQNFEKVGFREAMELLARRANIEIVDEDPEATAKRSQLLDTVQWAEERFRSCLLDGEIGARARQYLGTRKLTGPTVRKFGLGFAPPGGQWLVREAESARIDPELLRETGILGMRSDGSGLYDRFRDRLMFPIRDVRSRTLGFGGRILPDSKYADEAKYYNSPETPIFQKKELLYGLDVARHAGGTAGYIAVVEGYTDVMMAFQYGIENMVAPMGTALGESHVRLMRRFAPKVVLVFDADAGGRTGVDRALELFVSCDVELAVAVLPEGLDPCDLLVAQGADPLRKLLNEAQDALDFKLTAMLAGVGNSVDGTQRVIDEVLGVLAAAPDIPGQAGQVKRELLITRIAHRLGLRQETVWARFGELKTAKRRTPRRVEPAPNRSVTAVSGMSGGSGVSSATAAATDSDRRADPLERQLIAILLADADLVAEAYLKVDPTEFDHPAAQQVLAALYQLLENREIPNLDGLRTRIDEPAIINRCIELQEQGLAAPDRRRWFHEVLTGFADRKAIRSKKQLKDRLNSQTSDEEALELLRKIQGRT